MNVVTTNVNRNRFLAGFDSSGRRIVIVKKMYNHKLCHIYTSYNNSLLYYKCECNKFMETINGKTIVLGDQQHECHTYQLNSTLHDIYKWTMLYEDDK